MSEAALPAPPLLRVRSLSKTYRMGQRALPVLREVDLEVGEGEFVVLCGASGSGKSTLLHLLGGLDAPDSGTVEIHGQRLDEMNDPQAARFRNRHIGFVFQSSHLLEEMDALENVCLPARIGRGMDGPLAARARELLAQVGLSERMEHRPSELSGGEQQRVAIARALINQPRLLLADEPTGNLDSHTGGEILELLESLRTQHAITLLVATHDEKLATRAGRVLHLVDGHLGDK